MWSISGVTELAEKRIGFGSFSWLNLPMGGVRCFGRGFRFGFALLSCALGATLQGCDNASPRGAGVTAGGATGTGATGGSGGGAGTGGKGEAGDNGNGGRGGNGIQPPEAPSCSWLHGYEWTEGSEFTSVDVDADENTYVSGETSVEIDFGGGALDPTGSFVVSFDSDGEHRYTRPLEGSTAPQLVADDAGNTYLAGTFRDALTIGDETLSAEVAGQDYGYLASLDPAGEHRWTLVTSPARVGLGSLVLRLGPDGRLYLITTAVSEPFALGNEEYQTTDTGRDLLVIVLDTDGTVETDFTIGGPDDEHLRAADVGRDGNIYVYGAYWDTADLGGDRFVSNGVASTFLASFEADGSHRWSLGFSSTPTAPAPLAVGNAVYLGVRNGVAYDLDGEVQWTGEVGAVGSIEPHPTRGVYFGGFEARPSPQYDRLTLSRLNAKGLTLETYGREVVLVASGSTAQIRDLAARGDSVWLVADGDDAFPGLSEGFQATGMVCRIDDLGE